MGHQVTAHGRGDAEAPLHELVGGEVASGGEGGREGGPLIKKPKLLCSAEREKEKKIMLRTNTTENKLDFVGNGSVSIEIFGDANKNEQLNPTDLFGILEPHNSSIDVSELHKIGRQISRFLKCKMIGRLIEQKRK